MSKRFKSQDFFRYKKLGKRWRRPRGLQSKLRLRKGGSGMHVAVGYGSPSKAVPALINNEKDFEKDCAAGVLISSRVGSRKAFMLATKAKELNIQILNMKKVKKAKRLDTRIKKKTSEKKKAEKKRIEEAKEAAKTSEARPEKKIGFDEDVVPQILGGKTKTYRLRDHNLKVGDTVAFENTQKKEIFGHAKITKVEKVPVEKFNLNDPEHHVVYKNTEELIAALKRRNPDRHVTPKTEMFAYTYEFKPSDKTHNPEMKSVKKEAKK